MALGLELSMNLTLSMPIFEILSSKFGHITFNLSFIFIIIYLSFIEILL